MKQKPKKEIEPGNASLVKRVLTGMLLVALISSAVLSGAIGFLLLVIIINVLAVAEYQKLIETTGLSAQKITGQATGLLIIFASWLAIKNICPASVLFIILPVLSIIFFIELFRKSRTPFQNIGLTLLSFLWISLPLTLFLYTGFLSNKMGEYHPYTILGYFGILWLGDSGAYFTGKLLGKHKLFPRISPNKTWEGSVGGLALACLGAFINYTLFNQFSLEQWLLLAFIINITGTFGDFVKSMLKRSVGVKDSGNVLPGHGGIIDRFDSLIGSAPFVFLYLYYYA